MPFVPPPVLQCVIQILPITHPLAPAEARCNPAMAAATIQPIPSHGRGPNCIELRCLANLTSTLNGNLVHCELQLAQLPLSGSIARRLSTQPLLLLSLQMKSPFGHQPPLANSMISPEGHALRQVFYASHQPRAMLTLRHIP